MFKKLRDTFVTSQAVKRVAAHPQAFLAGSLAIEAFWTKNHEITKDFTPEFKEEQGRIWAGKVLECPRRRNFEPPGRLNFEPGWRPV
ncbi:hypothetical protein [Paraburkholderia sp. 22B1P]|uniref:hypothetical protein n=1 Tax=Paraburkholderia sp. 22B1P TaxID=3080498 RepID=UPI0030921D1F|nr:hypothetical protein PBP221_84940 [Paraburkholderia sp. 22B1P]